ncbi:MAG: Ig-like domain-containing protein [Gemmatimonadaceae bacterium]
MRRFATLTLAAFLVACGGGGEGPTGGGDGIAAVTLNAPSLGLFVGKSDQLAATARDAKGDVVAGAPAATWRSSNAVVATVTSSGLVTATAAGSADITATIGSKSATARVTVAAAPTQATVSMPGLTFTPFKVTLKVGGTVRYEFPSLAHNVIFDRVTGAPSDIPITSSATVSRLFPVAGFFRYDCTLHNGMTGEVEVVP